MVISWLRSKVNPKRRSRPAKWAIFTDLQTDWFDDRALLSASMVRDINKHTGSEFPNTGLNDPPAEINNHLYFMADDGIYGRELWQTHGAAASTSLVIDINAASSPMDLIVKGGKDYFNADDGEHGSALWVSDGTDAGIHLAENIAAPHSASDYLDPRSNPTDLIPARDQIYFAANDVLHVEELSVCDGGSAGTYLVTDINTNSSAVAADFPTTNSSNPMDLIALGNELYFAANAGIHRQHVWKTDSNSIGIAPVTYLDTNSMPVYEADGTAAGTVRLSDLTAHDTWSSHGIHGLSGVDEKLYLDSANSLWTSNSTAAGAHVVQDIITDTASAFQPWPANATIITKAANGALYFTANDDRGTKPWALHPNDWSALPQSAGSPYEVAEGQNRAFHAEAGGISTQALPYSWEFNSDGKFDRATGANAIVAARPLQPRNLHGGPGHHTSHVRVGDSSTNVLHTESADLTIDDIPLVLTNAAFDVTEGQKFNRNVASFTHPSGPEDVSAYQAAIDWGDGKTSKGAILQQGFHFRVAGQHVYSEQGTYGVKVSVSDQGGPAITTQSTITVHDALFHATRAHFRTNVGQPFSGVVARFQDNNPLCRLGQFAASINWGDGSTSQGIVQDNGRGHYVVLGTHIFFSSGTSAVDVTINDSGHPVTVAHSTAKIDALTLMARGLTAVAKVNTDFTVALAAFHNGNNSATATIDWADGSVSAGTLQPDEEGGFQVFGRHCYSEIGIHTVRVTITDSERVANTTGTVRMVA